MPVRKKGDKWTIGSGNVLYDTKAEAEKAFRAFMSKRNDRLRGLFGKKKKK